MFIFAISKRGANTESYNNLFNLHKRSYSKIYSFCIFQIRPILNSFATPVRACIRNTGRYFYAV